MNKELFYTIIKRGLYVLCTLFIIVYILFYCILVYNGQADVEVTLRILKSILLNIFIIAINVYVDID